MPTPQLIPTTPFTSQEQATDRIGLAIPADAVEMGISAGILHNALLASVNTAYHLDSSSLKSIPIGGVTEASLDTALQSRLNSFLTEVANGSVTEQKLDSQVSNKLNNPLSQIPAGSIDSDLLGANSVIFGKIGNNAIENRSLTNGAVDNRVLATNSVTDSNIRLGTISIEKLETTLQLRINNPLDSIEPQAIEEEKLSAAVTDKLNRAVEIPDFSVTDRKLSENLQRAITSFLTDVPERSVDTINLVNGAVTMEKLSTSLQTTIRNLQGGGSDLEDNSITEEKLVEAVRIKLNRTFTIPDNSIVESQLDFGVRSKLNRTLTISNGSIVEANLSTALQNKINRPLSSINDGSIGEVKLTTSLRNRLNSFLTSIGNDSVGTNQLQNGSVTTVKLEPALQTRLGTFLTSVPDDSVGTEQLTPSLRTTIQNLQGGGGDLEDNSITEEKLVEAVRIKLNRTFELADDDRRKLDNIEIVPDTTFTPYPFGEGEGIAFTAEGVTATPTEFLPIIPASTGLRRGVIWVRVADRGLFRNSLVLQNPEGEIRNIIHLIQLVSVDASTNTYRLSADFRINTIPANNTIRAVYRRRLYQHSDLWRFDVPDTVTADFTSVNKAISDIQAKTNHLQIADEISVVPIAIVPNIDNPSQATQSLRITTTPLTVWIQVPTDTGQTEFNFFSNGTPLTDTQLNGGATNLRTIGDAVYWEFQLRRLTAGENLTVSYNSTQEVLQVQKDVADLKRDFAEASTVTNNPVIRHLADDGTFSAQVVTDSTWRGTDLRAMYARNLPDTLAAPFIVDGMTVRQQTGAGAFLGSVSPIPFNQANIIRMRKEGSTSLSNLLFARDGQFIYLHRSMPEATNADVRFNNGTLLTLSLGNLRTGFGEIDLNWVNRDTISHITLDMNLSRANGGHDMYHQLLYTDSTDDISWNIPIDLDIPGPGGIITTQTAFYHLIFRAETRTRTEGSTTINEIRWNVRGEVGNLILQHTDLGELQHDSFVVTGSYRTNENAPLMEREVVMGDVGRPLLFYVNGVNLAVQGSAGHFGLNLVGWQANDASRTIDNALVFGSPSSFVVEDLQAIYPSANRPYAGLYDLENKRENRIDVQAQLRTLNAEGNLVDVTAGGAVNIGFSSVPITTSARPSVANVNYISLTDEQISSYHFISWRWTEGQNGRTEIISLPLVQFLTGFVRYHQNSGQRTMIVSNNNDGNGATLRFPTSGEIMTHVFLHRISS